MHELFLPPASEGWGTVFTGVCLSPWSLVPGLFFYPVWGCPPILAPTLPWGGDTPTQDRDTPPTRTGVPSLTARTWVHPLSQDCRTPSTPPPPSPPPHKLRTLVGRGWYPICFIHLHVIGRQFLNFEKD